MSQPKRIILRIRLNNFDAEPTDTDYSNIVSTFLTFDDRSVNKEERAKHYIHIEPLQEPEIQQTSFHIVLDIESSAFPSALLSEIPHEFYRVTRNPVEHQLYV